ncbi:MAG TPA: glucans biosynthesis protein MdoG, partial [Gammaproteobacteria bacterium]
MISTVFARRAAHGLFACALVAILCSASTAFAFDFDDVAALARRKARTPYVPPDRAQPRELELL